MISPLTGTPTTTLASTKLAPPPSALSKKGTTGKKGTRVQENIREENTAEGSTKRKRGRPPKRNVEKAPGNTKSVLEEFSTENIAKRAKMTKTPVGALDSTESVNKRVRRAGPYDGSPWGK
jgi:hypothetical protein